MIDNKRVYRRSLIADKKELMAQVSLLRRDAQRGSHAAYQTVQDCGRKIVEIDAELYRAWGVM